MPDLIADVLAHFIALADDLKSDADAMASPEAVAMCTAKLQATADKVRERYKTRLITVADGKAFAIVDAEDFEKLSQFTWGLAGPRKNYVWRQYMIGGKAHHEWMHRAVLQPPSGMEVDHINHNPLDNRRCNLRVCTRSQNNANRPSSRSKTGFRGVFIDARRPRRWYARIGANYRMYNLGSFASPEEAARAYDRAAREMFGTFAILNFQDEHVDG